jgi:hypothetical protein
MPGGEVIMLIELFGQVMRAYVPSGAVGCMLLGAGICFTLIYVGTTILACHIDDF